MRCCHAKGGLVKKAQETSQEGSGSKEGASGAWPTLLCAVSVMEACRRLDWLTRLALSDELTQL